MSLRYSAIPSPSTCSPVAGMLSPLKTFVGKLKLGMKTCSGWCQAFFLLLSSATSMIVGRLRSSSECHKGLVECLPFGLACSCNARYFNQIIALVTNCHTYLPFLSLTTLFSVANAVEFKAALDHHFNVPLSIEYNNLLYVDVEVRLKQLDELCRQLSVASQIKINFLACTRLHSPMSSDSQALVVLGNLRLLLDCVQGKRRSLEADWWNFLDRCPRKSEEMLRVLMEETRCRTDQLDGLSNISFHDFSTLGVGRWLNDEIINYFVIKWCSEAQTTLGLSTFFACKFLFQENACITAKSGMLTAQEGAQVLRWCRKTERALNFCSSTWDSVFIPIHENCSHWYSAFIDFRYRRIEVYDSLRETCVTNRQKPVPLRKNTRLMLVLMWLTEVLGHMRGDPVCLSDNPQTDWVFDPHAEGQVHFQPNAYDCGVHTLWQLQHVLEFRQVRIGNKCELDRLTFTDNMAGKRMRLAQEILRDCEP
ncbi:hypothetical protein D9757_014037 [Collybiopsis confluens]|uniref:Ubiquitin-like protease family profile domain-containing protein n=1 Tax=Collybiopsis confluens TaxID=2823264 RepID=A0A8H5GD92_9AGAR|nr:hypothetical protein D9757_014037 [Collybiopsis confluens]